MAQLKEMTEASVETVCQPVEDRAPGVLRGAVTLSVQTRQAQRLVKGRPGTAQKPAIIGLIGFANLLRPIWYAARADDPFADWWLIKIDEALRDSIQAIDATRSGLEQSFERADPLVVSAPASVKPARIVLQFSNPYAFHGARLIAAFDRLACIMLSAQHVGMTTPLEAESGLGQAGRIARRALLSPMGYRLTGVTRTDLEVGNSKAMQACACMGEPPADVLASERRARHTPTRIMPAAGGASHLTFRPLPSG